MKRFPARQETRRSYTGQFSDGSDRQLVIDIAYLVDVVDDTGIVRRFEFDHDPLDDEIAAKLPVPADIDPVAGVTKAQLARTLADAIQTAHAADWFNTKVQGDGSLAAVKNAASAYASTTLARAKVLIVRYANAP